MGDAYIHFTESCPLHPLHPLRLAPAPGDPTDRTRNTRMAHGTILVHMWGARGIPLSAIDMGKTSSATLISQSLPAGLSLSSSYLSGWQPFRPFVDEGGLIDFCSEILTNHGTSCSAGRQPAASLRDSVTRLCIPGTARNWKMASSYKRLTIKRFPRVQERETAEARYWRNFTNPEVQVILKG